MKPALSPAPRSSHPPRRGGAPTGPTPLARVVALTPAPAVDRVILVDALALGEVNRAPRASETVAGKGVNLARNVRGGGGSAVSVLPWGADPARLPEGSVPVPIAGPPRTNTVVIERSGVTTNLNESPDPLSAREWEALARASLDAIARTRATHLVVGGTFPALDDGHALDPSPLFAAARRLGARIVLDSGGAVLARVLAGGAPLDLVKPNRAELAEATGRNLATVGQAVAAARALRARGVARVLASLGADGLLLVDGERAVLARARARAVRNTTGAGDAALAGFLLSPEGALERAARWGALAVESPGVELGPLDPLPVTVRSVGVSDAAPLSDG